MKSIKSVAKYIVARLGFDLSAKYPLRFQSLPLGFGLGDILSLSGITSTAYAKVPLSQGRNRNGKPLLLDERVHILRRCVSQPMETSELANFLRNYGEYKYPRTLAERFQIERFPGGKVHDLPGWLNFLPWERSNSEQLQSNYLAQAVRNRIKFGKIDPTRIASIKEPADLRSLSYDSHAEQYLRLINSIKDKGLMPHYFNDTNIEVQILVKNGQCVWMLSKEGNHRAHIAAALELKEIPVKITHVIDFSHAAHWPNVINGNFTQEQAGFIFDWIFTGYSHGE